MNFTLLLFLLCPLMMIFCMVPMFRKNKKGQGQGQQNTPNVQAVVSQSEDEIQALQLRIADLMDENHKLKNQDQDSANQGNVLHVVENSREKRKGSSKVM